LRLVSERSAWREKISIGRTNIEKWQKIKIIEGKGDKSDS
jgi:hypothetical protein